MISRFLSRYKNICTDIKKVENFEEAATSKEMYILHHLAECRFTAKELIEMGKYYNRPPEEFLFVEESIHASSEYLHKGRKKDHLIKTAKNKDELFTFYLQKFKEKTGLNASENFFYFTQFVNKNYDKFFKISSTKTENRLRKLENSVI